MAEHKQPEENDTVFSPSEKTAAKQSRWFRISIGLNLLLLIWACVATYWARHEVMAWIREHRTNRVVLIGDSLTVGGGNWDWRLGRWDTRNLGGNGYVVQHVYGVAREQIIKRNPKPECCLVMVGINDLALGFDVETVKQNYKMLLDMLRQANVPTVIELTLYRKAGTLSDKVDNLNAFLTDYAKKHNMTVLDLNPKLSENRKLKNEYTTDGVHLTKDAYAIWGEEIKTILKDMNL
jgi:lysophospholipase L1-like esterase